MKSLLILITLGIFWGGKCTWCSKRDCYLNLIEIRKVCVGAEPNTRWQCWTEADDGSRQRGGRTTLCGKWLFINAHDFIANCAHSDYICKQRYNFFRCLSSIINLMRMTGILRASHFWTFFKSVCPLSYFFSSRSRLFLIYFLYNYITLSYLKSLSLLVTLKYTLFLQKLLYDLFSYLEFTNNFKKNWN